MFDVPSHSAVITTHANMIVLIFATIKTPLVAYMGMGVLLYFSISILHCILYHKVMIWQESYFIIIIFIRDH